MTLRMLALAVGCVAVEHRRGCEVGAGAVVAHIDPQPSRARLPGARSEHGYGAYRRRAACSRRTRGRRCARPTAPAAPRCGRVSR
ncbi:hypothetical protein J2851_004895 [Azospirillum rugosum]|uniref:Uncharacterized protein n=1 Tax=Azospirillum rugosum TaxID=416170 RepID=A0ABS4SRM4_9PROT|nr:hypothetical protein [Azospirillum rugosum]MDQ0528466.1 hypothetical protein [Azospirillum rugosum]